MSIFEVNKILATIILIILVFLIINYVGNKLINPVIPEKLAYEITVPEDLETETKSIKSGMEIEPILPILVSASIENGQKLAKKCSSCHTFNKGEANKIGPNLFGIIGSEIGSKAGYAYSSALISLEDDWNFENIAKFLYKPKEYIDGTKMNFAGLKKVEDRANLVLFLRDQSDNPAPLP